MINPSSKIALKLSCLQSTNGDVKRAEELYKFLSEGIETMPDYPIEKPTTMQQIGATAKGLFEWVKDNQGDIMTAVNYIQQMRGGAPISGIPTIGASEIPTLPTLNQ